MTDDAETDLRDRSERLSSFLDTELRKQQQVVEFAATDRRALNHGTATQRSMLESFVDTTAFNGVSVVNTTGKIQALVTDEGYQPEIVDSDISNRTYVQRALGGEPYISRPLRAKTGNRIVVMSGPVTVDGEVRGSINAAYHLNSTEMFAGLASENEAGSVTVESNGLVLYSTLKDEETLTKSADLDAVDWTVTAHYDKNAVNASAKQLAVFQGLMGLVLLGTLAAFGWWVYRAQILQINQLLGQLNALEQRQYDQRIELDGGHEWEQIGQALGELRESLTQREQMLLVHNRILRHNLRNKLNVIRSRAEILDNKNGSSSETAEIQQATDTLLGLADRARTTERLLDPPDEDAQTDIADVVRERTDTIATSHPELSVNVSAPETEYVACGTEIGTAIEELLQNVVDHAGPEPTAHVTVAEAGDCTVVRIEDDGDGIPDSEAKLVSGDHDITQLQHTVGIGLRLVDWIVSRYDGTFRVPQTDENGCLVEMELPRAPSETPSQPHSTRTST
ncbi:cache domain-containing sensor histidine kinase [Halovenus salina]|uniref:histidine kinase n=1 Tax=Halovenus salina TaxID=1510225 RepID=A0ABD5W6Y9_9EURY|nr:ATP-binding protein [Halovenus salina]